MPIEEKVDNNTVGVTPDKVLFTREELEEDLAQLNEAYQDLIQDFETRIATVQRQLNLLN